MATRRESVQVDMTGNLISRLSDAATETARLRMEVDRLGRARVNIAVDTSQVASAQRDIARMRAELERMSRVNVNARVTQTFTQVTRGSQQANGSIGETGESINQLTGRLSLLADGLLVLGPGLVPIAAVGAQALGGLTAAATAAAIAGGSAIVAFQGLGDAVTAVQEYQLEPTVDGLEKAREAMSALGPDAQRFVMEFQKFRPVLGDMKDAAASGWFPGLTESLESFEKLGPKIEGIFFKAGEAGGFLVEGAAESLASQRWAPFMDFIEEEVPTAMGSLTSIMGDLAHGAAEMFMAFDPSNDAFLGWLEDVAQGFDNWASSSQGQESIQGFLEYARQNGPAVADLFSSLVGALAAIVQAAAPIGGVVLSGLTAVADMVKVIADSDMATPILAAVAAMRIFNRLSVVALSAQSRVATAPPPMIRDPNAPFGPMTASQAAFVAQQNRAAERQAAALRRQQAMGAGVRGGAAIGMVALASSGLTQDMEAANTASMALLGTMIAPGWGTAAGLIVGGMMDIAGANDDFVAAVERGNAALEQADFTTAISSISQARTELEGLQADAQTGSLLSPGDVAMDSVEGVKSWFGASQAQEAEGELAALEERARVGQEAVAGLGEAFGMTLGPVDGSARSIEELNGVLEAAKPAMDALGISVQEYLQGAALDELATKTGYLAEFARAAQAEGGVGAKNMDADAAAKAKYMDTAQAKVEGYTAALAKMVREEGTAAERATGLGEALDALLDPVLDAEAALSQQRETLKSISELNADGGFTVKNEVGRANLATTRAYVDALKERLTTMVKAGRSEKDVAGALNRSREQFIQSGIAAGFSARQMRKRADAIGLTPKLVQTTFKAIGLSEFDRNVETLKTKINALPRNVQTEVRQNGIPKTMGEVDDLVAKYKLTEKDRQALISLAGTSKAIGDAFAVKSAIDQITGKTVYINTVRTFTTPSEGRRSANGSTVPKDGGSYSDRFPYLLAPGEEVISNRYGQADRNRGLLKDINAGRLASGGTAGRGRNSSDPWGVGSSPAVWPDFHGHTEEVKKSKEEIAKERKERKEAARERRRAMRDYAQGVQGSLAGELTGGGLAGFDTGVAANRNDAKAMLKALIKARKKGLSGPLLDLVAASGDLSLAEQMADLSRAEIAKRERQYGASRGAEAALGNFAAGEKFDKDRGGRGRGKGGRGRGGRGPAADPWGINDPWGIAGAVERGAERGTATGANRARRARSRETANRVRVGR